DTVGMFRQHSEQRPHPWRLPTLHPLSIASALVWRQRAPVVGGSELSRPSSAVRLLSWNVRQGGGSRIARQVDVIARAAPDVVALQEVAARTADEYRTLLASLALDFCINQFSVAPEMSELTGARRY